MISLITPENRADFLQACLFDEIFGARMLTLLECYGHDISICGLWLQTDANNIPTAAISRFAGLLTISATPGANMDELAEFADVIGGFRYIEASADVCKSLSRGGEYSAAYAMRYDSGKFGGDFGKITENSPIREIYDIVCAADPSFEKTTDLAGWYTHTSHLFRHGLGFAGLLLENGRPVSTGGVYTASERIAVIGCVATLPGHRGKGYAALITKYLVNRILGLGKTPMLLCADDRLAGYYARLGFTEAGKCGFIRLCD